MAYQKPTFQSTTRDKGDASSNAVDDSLNTCTSTNLEPYNYFEIDLLEERSFVEITINNEFLGSKYLGSVFVHWFASSYLGKK